MYRLLSFRKEMTHVNQKYRPLKGNSHYNKSIWIIFVGTTFSFAIVVGLVAYLLVSLSSTVNRQDFLRTSQNVNMSFLHEQEKLKGLVWDNAYWNDAARHTGDVVDTMWLDEAWGSTAQDNIPNYDMALVAEKSGQVLWISAAPRYSGVTHEQFKTTITDLISDLSGDRQMTGATTNIYRLDTNLIALAVAPITVQEEKLIPQVSISRFLIFGKILDADILGRISNRTGAYGLHLSDVEPDSGKIPWVSIPVENRVGDILSFAVWYDTALGATALKNMTITVILILGGFAFYTLWLLKTSWYTYLELISSEGKSWAAARKDTLTGLPNRLALHEAIRNMFSTPSETSSLILIDLDNFKSINDFYGHELGDSFLREIASTLKDVAGQEQMVARLDGDEFAIFVKAPEAGKYASRIAQQILSRISTPITVEGRTLSVSASIGLTDTQRQAGDISEFFKQADFAMYTAKNNGRSQMCIYDAELSNKRRWKMQLAADLRQALNKQKFTVVYQPFFECETHKLAGVEALVRWSHWKDGLISPEVFIPIAEEFDLISELGIQVLERACAEAKAWSDLKLSVNVSPFQLKNSEFLQTALTAIDVSGIARNRVEFEVTESQIIEHPQQAKVTLDRLKAEGIGVVLDDFGTGYSSLGYLRQFPFDKLKLDKSMLNGAAENLSSQSMLEAAISLAKSLNLKVTAEGVEREDEALMLAKLNCHYLQGYLLGKPQPAHMIEMLLPK